MNYSTAKRYACELFGPSTQIRPYNGGYRVLSLHGRTRTVYGEGLTYEAALVDCFGPEPARENSVVSTDPNGSSEKA